MSYKGAAIKKKTYILNTTIAVNVIVQCSSSIESYPCSEGTLHQDVFAVQAIPMKKETLQKLEVFIHLMITLPISSSPSHFPIKTL